MPRSEVPDVVVRRLPTYLMALERMLARGEEVVSSAELGKVTGMSAAQIRKDLSYFGEFGRQGLGYEVEFLRDQLKRILQVDREWHIVVVGAGALGRALVHYREFTRRGLNIVAVFDNDPGKVGLPLGGLIIQPMCELETTIRRRHIEIAIIAVPPDAAQAVADELALAGITAVLNYAPATLRLDSDIHVAQIDPVASLQSITYYL